MSHYNFLNIGVWNIHGLFSRVNNSKLCKLEETVFLEKIKKIEILCLQETQCGISETTSLSLEGYRLIPFERNKSGDSRYFGGPLLLMKSGIRKGIKILDSVNGDIICIKLQKDFFGLENDVFVCFVYASPLFFFLMDFFFWKKIYKTMVWHGNLAKTTITQKFTIQRYSK